MSNIINHWPLALELLFILILIIGILFDRGGDGE